MQRSRVRGVGCFGKAARGGRRRKNWSMIGHEKPLPALPHECRRADETQRRYDRFWRIRKSRSALGMVKGNTCRRGRAIETSVLVFQFNDLWLRHGGSQRNLERFTQAIG